MAALWTYTAYQPLCESLSVWDISTHTRQRSKLKSSVQNMRLSLNEGQWWGLVCCCGNRLGEMNLHVVEETEYHSKNHVHNPYDNRHLHFVGVQESQLVRCNIPDLWVKEQGEKRTRFSGVWSIKGLWKLFLWHHQFTPTSSSKRVARYRILDVPFITFHSAKILI